MKRKRTRSLGAPATEPGKFLGVPTPLLLVGLAAAAGLAFINSGDGSQEPAVDAGTSTPGTGSSTPTKTSPTGTSSGGTKQPSTGISPPQVKPYRRPLKQKASPQLLVFVNSFGGEGIFDRLRNKATLLDGNGLDRILTLDNNEFAGWATGEEWIAQDTLQTYTQVYNEIGSTGHKIGYNYWIQKSQTTQVHAPAAQFSLSTAYGFKWTSSDHESTIRQFYFDRYTL
jgi:hypothetical protein